MSTQNVGTVSTVSTESQTVSGVLRPPKPVEKLKAERIQELLKAMPGWRLGAGGRSISRRREFDTPAAAAAFAGFVAGLASTGGWPVSLDLEGGTVTITLPGRPPGRKHEELSLETLGFAQQIG